MNHRHSFLKLASFAFACLFSMSFAWGQTVSVTPSSSTKDVGEAFTLAVHVDGITHVQASHVELSFNNSVIHYTAVAANGTFFPSGSTGFFASNPPPGSGVNTVSVDQAVVGVPTLSGSGDLFTIGFIGMSAGNIPIGITVSIRDSLNHVISTTTTGATVIIRPSISGNAGIGGAVLSYTDGSPQTVTADGSGNYSFIVSYNWSGTVTPSLTGYTFSPVNRSYTNVTTAQTSQNYTATLNTYTISGTIQDGTSAAIGGVLVTASGGFSGTATTDISGNYTITGVPHFSTAIVLTPTKTGYTFAPVTRTVAGPVAANVTAEDFTGTINVYTITASAGANGTIAPLGVTNVNHGGGQSYTITPDAGYHVADVLVDGVSVGAVTTYDFTNVTTNHTISASFAINAYTITATAGANGTIAPPGVTNVNHGGSQSYTITPDAGYHVADVLVDGVSVGAVATYDFTNVTTNHTISASFAINAYTITATAGANGTIAPPGVTNVNHGGSQSYTITPDAGYHVADVLVDGVSVGAVATYDFTNVTTNHTISATFAINQYTITASAGANGAIAPLGVTNVNHGGSQSYTITPDAGYHVADVLVDGVSVGAVATYDFTNVTANHTISATFAINQYTITASAGANGTIAPLGVTNVNHGGGQSYTITPDAGYHVADVLVDGVSVGAVATYDFTNVTTNHTISVTFAINQYTITASAGANGTIAPLGVTNVNHGGSQSYTITPDAGYHVADVLVDGVSVGAVATYDFTNVTANHTISASFAINAYTITATAGANGTIAPPGVTNVNHGGSQSYTITPDAGYHVADVLVDGVSVGAVATYDFTNVTANHTISVSFAINQYTITASAGANGAIAPLGVTNVTHGGSQSYTITPDAGYHVADVLVDGVSVGAVATYDFTNVTANHTISVSFAINQYTITAPAGANGAIAPLGVTNVTHGGSQSYTITPDAGYHVADVLVDGVSVGAVATYDFTNVTTNHTISATFAINQYTITASAGANGAIAPLGATNVNHGGSQSYTITPDAGYHVADVLVDGVSVGAVATYDFTNVTTNHTISATFAINQYTITASAGANGAIAPLGVTNVTHGGSQSYTITPDAGYHVADVLVDGVSVGAVATYDFTNVTTNHTISATFAINQYTITASAGANGAIAPLGVTNVTHGGSQSYTITPDAGYHVADVLVDGVSVGAVATYDFTNVTANHTISATFAINQYTITASAGANGTIAPLGVTNVNHGGSQSYTITPDAGYHVADVLVDGVSVGAVATYDFTNVTTNHTISASFAINQYTITASAGANGTIAPPGVTNVNHGGSQSYTITPDAGYHVADVLVDGVSVGAVTTYDFTNVTTNHTISATFAINQYTITASAGANGAIAPLGVMNVTHGGSQSYTITPDAGYHVADVLVDGVSVGAVATYDFTNVTANHTISASFAINAYTITATTGANGTIAPPGVTNVNHGGSQSYTITPDAGYHVADVLVDGVSVGAVATYDFTNVTTNHTISVSFAINTYTITPTAGANGTITPATPQSVNHGSTPQFTMAGIGNYHLGSLLVDGSPVNPVSPYTFPAVTSNHTIHARFAQTDYTVTGADSLSIDTDGDGTIDMTMKFTSVPAGGGTVSVFAYLAAPPGGQAVPVGSLTYYVNITSSMPNHSFSVNVKSDMVNVAGAGSSTNLVYYHNSTPLGWVLMPGTFASTDAAFSGNPSFSFTTDHFTNFTVFNAPSNNVYLSTEGATAAPGTVYPNATWDHSGLGANDWKWNGAQEVSFYLVPQVGSVFNAGDVTVEWNNSVMTFASADFTGTPFATATATPVGSNQLDIHLDNASDITIGSLGHIVKLNFTLVKPGHSALSVVQSDFSKVGPSSVYMIPYQGEVKAYLGDFATGVDVSTGNGAIDFNDLTPWSISYWSGVPGFPGGMTNYKRKFDIGPTQDGFVFSLPVADSKIDFEDLLIFSIAYGQSSAHQLPKLSPSKDPVEVSLGRAVVVGNETRIPVMIGGGVRDVRGMTIEVDGSFGSFLGVEKGDLLNAYQTPVMVMSRSEGRKVFVDLAVMGSNVEGMDRSGDVAWLRFTGRPFVKLSATLARNSSNLALNVLQKRGEGEAVPTSYVLQQNYPNPFNPTTVIEYEIPFTGQVTLEVYSMLGERVASLVNNVQEAGYYQVVWDGKDERNHTVATGVYLYRVRAGDFSSVKKMMFLK